MPGAELSDGFTARLKWAIGEAAVIAGILVFWIGVGIVLTGILTVIAYAIGSLPLELLEELFDFTNPSGKVLAAVMPLTIATTLLYILGRVGTLLIDRYYEQTVG